MVRYLRLLNFKSHKNSKLEFCSGINGIIGISQSGKTNILRAINLIVNLKSKSKKLIRNGQDNFNIKLETFDNHIVELQKGSLKIDNKEFRKFGRNIPEVKEEVFNVLKLSDINFHNQLDSSFIILSNPSQVSKIINDVTGMEDFDKWINKANERIKDLNAQKKYVETSIIRSERKLEKLDKLEEIEPILSKAQILRRKRIKLERKYEKINLVYKEIMNTKNKIDSINRVNEIKPDISQLVTILKNKEKLIEKEEILEEYLKRKIDIRMEKKKYLKLANEFILILKENKKCPTCLNEIKQSTLRELENELLTFI